MNQSNITWDGTHSVVALASEQQLDVAMHAALAENVLIDDMTPACVAAGEPLTGCHSVDRKPLELVAQANGVWSTVSLAMPHGYNRGEGPRLLGSRPVPERIAQWSDTRILGGCARQA